MAPNPIISQIYFFVMSHFRTPLTDKAVNTGPRQWRGHSKIWRIFMNSLWESEKQCWLLFITCLSPNLWSSCKDVESLAVCSTWSSPDNLFCCGWRFNLQVRERTLMIRTSQVTCIVLYDFYGSYFFSFQAKSPSCCWSLDVTFIYNKCNILRPLVTAHR